MELEQIPLSRQEAALLYAILTDALDQIWWHVYPDAVIRGVRDRLQRAYQIADHLTWMGFTGEAGPK